MFLCGISTTGARRGAASIAWFACLSLLAWVVSACAAPAAREGAEERRSAPFEDAFVSYSLTSGHGTPFLLMHGWASDSMVWDLLAPRLRSLGPSIAVDAPGSGPSPRGSVPFSYQRYADASATALAHEGVASAIVIAHSFGSFAAREFVRRYPERTCAIILLDGSFGRAFPDDAAAQAFRASLSAQPWPGLLQARDAPSNASDETLRLLPAMHRRASRESAIEWIDALFDERIYQTDRIEAPIRLIVRAESTWMDGEEIDRLRVFAPRLQVVRVANASHFLAWDAPDEVAELIRVFVRTVECEHATR
jgi:pimeloyl-ACP methyl ester carboxylesterase